MALTKVTEGVRTLGTGEVAVGNISGSAAASAGTFLKQDGTWAEAATDTTQIESDIALLGFKVAVAGSMGKYNLIDQTEDAFMDTTGIDASETTDGVRSASNYYSGASGSPVTATGGTITTDGDYTIHSFTSTSGGTFTTDTAQSVDLLVVAGGGGGGAYCGGGGGAGGYISTIAHAITPASYSVTVGAGGAAGTGSSSGAVGLNSQFGAMTAAVGGGFGNGYLSGSPGNGGSGGGSTTSTTSTGTAGQGYAGGCGSEAASQDGGGGGGAGAVGGNGVAGGVSPGNLAGNGGVGLSNSITGSAVFYAGGGGGGRGGSAISLTGQGEGGNGGGGRGSSGATANAAVAGTANTGGGGGAGGHPTTSGAAGGSGIVILRRPTTAEGFNDMTLVSLPTEAEAAPTKGDLVMTYTTAGGGSTTVGTDLTAEMSADDGSTWTDLGLVTGDIEGTTGGHTIIAKHNVTISSTITLPYKMRYRIKTLNQTATKVTRIQAVSLGWS